MPLHVNRWKDQKTHLSHKENRERREQLFDELGNCISDSFNELFNAIPVEQKKLLFMASSKPSSIGSHEIPEEVKRIGEEEKAKCLDQPDIAIQKFFAASDSTHFALKSANVSCLLLECHRLIIRDRERRLEITAVCLQYGLTVDYTFQSVLGMHTCETATLAVGAYICHKRNMAPKLVPHSLSGTSMTGDRTRETILTMNTTRGTGDQGRTSLDAQKVHDYLSGLLDPGAESTAGGYTPATSTLASRSPSPAAETMAGYALENLMGR